MSLRRYRDISPVTLQVVGGAESSLYCEQVEGVAGQVEGGANLVESFLVEVYRCKLCQFTCGLKTAIGSHLQLRHRPPELTCLGGAEEEAGLALSGPADTSRGQRLGELLHHQRQQMGRERVHAGRHGEQWPKCEDDELYTVYV